MSKRSVQFLKFAAAHVVLSTLAMIALVEFAKHHRGQGSAVGTSLGILGAILFFGPFAIIAAGYAAWMATNQRAQFPHSGFGLRLPLYSVIAALLLLPITYALGGLYGIVPFDLVIYVPATLAFIGAQFAATASFRTRIVRVNQ
jgi:hypothetical protein